MYSIYVCCQYFLFPTFLQSLQHILNRCDTSCSKHVWSTIFWRIWKPQSSFCVYTALWREILKANIAQLLDLFIKGYILLNVVITCKLYLNCLPQSYVVKGCRLHLRSYGETFSSRWYKGVLFQMCNMFNSLIPKTSYFATRCQSPVALHYCEVVLHFSINHLHIFILNVFFINKHFHLCMGIW